MSSFTGCEASLFPKWVSEVRANLSEWDRRAFEKRVSHAEATTASRKSHSPSSKGIGGAVRLAKGGRAFRGGLHSPEAAVRPGGWRNRGCELRPAPPWPVLTQNLSGGKIGPRSSTARGYNCCAQGHSHSGSGSSGPSRCPGQGRARGT